MEETLGKRIVTHRKRLGLTQDALAELLGVTAQAVSKWENDQSCPDITMLPKLADIFNCTTDALLGLEHKSVPEQQSHPTEAVCENETGETQTDANGTWELRWDGSRRGGIGIALWLLLTGSLSLASVILGWGVSTWHILWPAGLLVFGLFGLLRKVTALRLGIFLFGGYFLMWHIGFLPPVLTVLKWELVIPGALLIFGTCTLIDSLKKPKKSIFHIRHNGKPVGKSNCHCTLQDDTFDCSTSFGENRHLIDLPRLAGGSASLSFGQLHVDLTGCGEIADGCHLDLESSFGELELTVPRTCRVEQSISTAFASTQVIGTPLPNAASTIYVNGSASFGELTIRYA